MELFLRDGYAKTTVAAVARKAEVSVQTVFNVFDTKSGLLKASYDIALVGDDEPIPLGERADVRALYADPDPESFLRGYARLGRTLLERVGPLLLQVEAGAAAGDGDLVDLANTMSSERLNGTKMVATRLDELGALAPLLTIDEARDRIWTLNSVQVWNLLTARGYSGDAYEQWVGELMCASTLRGRVR
jgi:AcrR family transcriptional regulator